ncbi:MAG: hypothetical protein WA005_15695 [Candidatus Binataceae bacterium]
MLAAAVMLPPAATAAPSASAPRQTKYFLPDASASRELTVAKEDSARAGVTVLTEAVAIKETGPKETIARFGEVYAFSPAFIAIHQDEPTQVSFFNLQPDDDHDLMIVDPELKVLMYVDLPPLKETSYVFTFHRAGLFTFYCTLHQPAMTGQVLVIPPDQRQGAQAAEKHP